MTPENLQTDLTLKTEINLYYDLFVPPQLEKRAPLLLAVHGYGAHKRYMMREAQMVAPGDFVIASIQAPHQHFRQTPDGYKIGFGWLTDYKSAESVSLHHNFALEIIARLAEKDLIDAARVYLYGFSQACALNFRFAFTYPEKVRGVIGVCGGIPGDLDENPDYKTLNAETFYLYATTDEFYPLEKYLVYEQKLKDRLPNLTTKQYEATHEISGEMREDIKIWLNRSIR